MGLNLRGLFGEIIPELSPEKQAELQKLKLEVERIKASKKLEGDALGTVTQTWIFVSGIVVFALVLGVFFTVPKLVNQSIAVRGGFSFIDGNMIKKEDVPLALEYQYKWKIIKDNKVSLKDPWLNVYANDDKERKARNAEVLGYLQSTSDSLKRELNK